MPSHPPSGPHTPEPDPSGPPIRSTKLALPRDRGGLIPRPRLGRALSAAEAPLTILSAPTGYGKTSAARAWARGQGAALGWVTLDAGDDDPARLWTYVAVAVDRVRQGLGRMALRRLAASQGDVLAAVDELINGIAAFGAPLVIVLDDLHAVTDARATASLEYFVEWLPPAARLVVLSRTDPAMRLAPLRARGALAELRASDLAFTHEEATELLVEREGNRLTPDDVGALLERTEGWPAAVYLAALYLRGQDDPSAAIRDFTGDHRHVAAYLSREVVDQVEPGLHSFLLHSAVLGRFTPAMADAALERSDAAERIAELERSNLFLVPLDSRGEWYRYHALFRELLGVRLAAASPGAAEEIHRRASAWCRAAGLPAEAAEHASAAGDHGDVAALLAENHLPLIDGGLSLTYLRWLRTIPAGVAAGIPLLDCVAAVAAMLAREPAAERRLFLARADRARAERPDLWSPYCEAMLGTVHAATIDGDVGEAVRWGVAAAAAADSHVDALVTPTHAALANARYHAGDLDGARADAQRAVAHPLAGERLSAQVGAYAVLALAELARGQSALARDALAKADELCRGAGLREIWIGAVVAEAAARVAAQAGDLPRAEREAERAVRLHEGVSRVGEASALLALALVRGRRGRLSAADAALGRAREIVAELSDPGRLPAAVEEAAAELEALRAGPPQERTYEPLSDLELAVLDLMGTDLTLREIGAELFLSVNTIKTRANGLYRKLGVGSRAEALARAASLGLLEPAPDAEGAAQSG